MSNATINNYEAQSELEWHDLLVEESSPLQSAVSRQIAFGRVPTKNRFQAAKSTPPIPTLASRGLVKHVHGVK